MIQMRIQTTTKAYLKPHFEVYTFTWVVPTHHPEADMRGHPWGLILSSPRPVPTAAPERRGRHSCRLPAR